jgi:hypothetical protein
MKNTKINDLMTAAGPLKDGFAPTDTAFREKWETAIANIKTWQMGVEDIRQISFDGNIRSCRANFVYQNVPSLPTDPFAIALGAMLGALPHQPGEEFCSKEFQYTIQLLLDKPGQFYVAWECQG